MAVESNKTYLDVNPLLLLKGLKLLHESLLRHDDCWLIMSLALCVVPFLARWEILQMSEWMKSRSGWASNEEVCYRLVSRSQAY